MNKSLLVNTRNNFHRKSIAARSVLFSCQQHAATSEARDKGARAVPEESVQIDDDVVALGVASYFNLFIKSRQDHEQKEN